MNFRELTTNRWFGRVLLAAFLAAAAYLLAQNPEQYRVLSRLEIGDFAALLAVNLASFLVTAVVSWHLLRSVGAAVPWSTNLALTFLANFLNYFGPAQPGMGAKALYLRAMRNVSFGDFAIATGTNALVMVLVSGFAGVLVTGWVWTTQRILLIELCLLSFAMVVTVSALLLLGARISRFQGVRNAWAKALGDTITGVALLWGRGGAMLVAFALVAFQYAVSAFAIWLSYRAIGAAPGYSIAVLIAAFLSVANIVPVTPNNIGVSELVMGAVAQLSGVGFAEGLVAGVIMRGFHVLISVFALPYAGWQLRRASKRVALNHKKCN